MLDQGYEHHFRFISHVVKQKSVKPVLKCSTMLHFELYPIWNYIFGNKIPRCFYIWKLFLLHSGPLPSHHSLYTIYSEGVWRMIEEPLNLSTNQEVPFRVMECEQSPDVHMYNSRIVTALWNASAVIMTVKAWIHLSGKSWQALFFLFYFILFFAIPAYLPVSIPGRCIHYLIDDVS